MSKMGQTMVALGVVAGLGVAALPLSSFAVETASQNVSITAKVKETISLTLEGVDASQWTDATTGENATLATLDFGELEDDGAVKTAAVKATVVTTAADGYTLTLKDADSDTSMKKVGATAAIVAANDGTAASELSTTVSQWGYNTNGGNSFLGITEAGATIASSATSGSAESTVTFGLRIVAGQTAGTYKDEVVFTATTNAPVETP